MSVDERSSFLNGGKQIKEAYKPKEVGTPVKQTADDTLSRKYAKKVVILYVFVIPYILVMPSSY